MKNRISTEDEAKHFETTFNILGWPKSVVGGAQTRYRLRSIVYWRLYNQNNKTVPCFVCQQHVPESNATLEHILRNREGGTNKIDNLSISHNRCNMLRERKGSNEDHTETNFLYNS